MRIAIAVEYDGTNYCGWQIQPNGVTVQQKLEDALYTLTGGRISVTGSGRTDSGVHALCQVAHFDVQSSIPPEKFAPALNAMLPDDIRVISSREVSEDFHARFTAKRKTYRYRFYESDMIHPLLDRYAARVGQLDVSAMDRAAKLFVGEHDFRAFMASGSSVKTTVRTVYISKVERNGGYIDFTISGNGFLYNMVRIMAGALCDIGQNRMTGDELKAALSGSERSLLGKTMPAKGLTLVRVEYEDNAL